MKDLRFALSLIAILVGLAAAQDNRVPPPLTARENSQAISGQSPTGPVTPSPSSDLPFCPPKTCLYYAGDFDSTDTNANGLFNSNDSNDGLIGWTWVGVKPNLWPIPNNGYGYLVNVEDAKPKNHRGWKNDLDDCYPVCNDCGTSYGACNEQGIFDELSVALTGKKR